MMTALVIDLTQARAWALIGSVCGTILAAVGVAAVVWAVLKPWLRTQLVEPLHETRHQVTVNGHSSETPTVLDLLSELRTGQADLRTQLQVAETGIRADLSAHIRASRRHDRQVDRRLDDLEQTRAARPGDPDRKD